MLDYAGLCCGVLWDGVDLCVVFLEFVGSKSKNRDGCTVGLHGSRYREREIHGWILELWEEIAGTCKMVLDVGTRRGASQLHLHLHGVDLVHEMVPREVAGAERDLNGFGHAGTFI